MGAAIIHYWLLNMRGGENVVEAMCRMLPEAELFTLFYEPERVCKQLLRKRRLLLNASGVKSRSTALPRLHLY